jgi:hypothetical protein
LESSDSENDFLYGDIGIELGVPLRESFGGARRLLVPEDEPALACSFSEECGTVGQTALGGLEGL